MNTDMQFQERQSIERVKEGAGLAPKPGPNGCMPCRTTDAESGEGLMLGGINTEAFRPTIETGEARYFSRARQVLWHKGAASGLELKLVETRIDDAQLRANRSHNRHSKSDNHMYYKRRRAAGCPPSYFDRTGRDMKTRHSTSCMAMKNASPGISDNRAHPIAKGQSKHRYSTGARRQVSGKAKATG
ncbi:hypothetical protein GYB14_23890, partial [bacterium]|nr:hypothetical protein [bacterium]